MAWTPPQRISGETIVLRCLVSDDAQAVSELVTANLDYLSEWMPWTQFEPLSLSERRKLLEGWNETGDVGYGLFVDRELVGVCGLNHRIGKGGVELGYWLGADRTGNGYMTEAVMLATEAAFTNPEIDRVEIHHDKANVRSFRVAELAGYTLVSETPDEANTPAEVGIECLWRLTRAEQPDPGR